MNLSISTSWRPIADVPHDERCLFTKLLHPARPLHINMWSRMDEDTKSLWTHFVPIEDLLPATLDQSLESRVSELERRLELLNPTVS